MADAPSYRELQEDYNRLMLYSQHLKDKNDDLTNLFEDAEKQVNEMISEVKKLCLSILERDRKMMALGSNKPLSSRNVRELIRLTKESDASQHKEKNERMEQLIKTNEERAEIIRGLRDQLERALRGAGNALKDLLENENEAEKETQPEKEEQQVQESVSVSTATGILTADETESEENEEGEEVVESIPIGDNSQPPITQRPLVKSTGAGGVSTAPRVMVHVANLNSIAEQLTKESWEILRIIGEDGISELPEIIEIASKSFDCGQGKLRLCALEMAKSTILIAHQLSTGLRRNFYAFELSEIGAKIFAEKFGKEPRICEVQSLARDHDNPMHGYGIKDMCTVLRASGEYESVATNRKKCTFRLSNGQSYIPDAVARCKNSGAVHYYEYECGNHTQADFNSKCDKAVQVTDEIRFVCPSMPVVEKSLRPQARKWIESRGGAEKLGDIKIFITTLTALKDGTIKYTLPDDDM